MRAAAVRVAAVQERCCIGSRVQQQRAESSAVCACVCYEMDCRIDSQHLDARLSFSKLLQAMHFLRAPTARDATSMHGTAPALLPLPLRLHELHTTSKRLMAARSSGGLTMCPWPRATRQLLGREAHSRPPTYSRHLAEKGAAVPKGKGLT